MLGIVLFSAALGWCGTPWPWWWRRKPPLPPPPPDWTQYFQTNPISWNTLTGIIGGVIGGLIMNGLAGSEQITSIGLVAFAGGRIVTDLVNTVRNAMK
jgi:hypothetical protein